MPVLLPELDEAAFYFAPRSLADEPAFLRGAVMVRANAGAAFVGGSDGLLERVCSVAVKVTAEDSLEIEFGKTAE
jgi:hypothetical protein